MLAVTAALTGLAGSLHCVGMCGPFAVSCCATVPGRRALGRVGLYHLGKWTSYATLGALAGRLGQHAGASSYSSLQVGLALALGAVLVSIGAALQLGDGVGTGRLVRRLPIAPLTRALAAVRSLPGPTGALLVGTVSGLLPCPLVYAAVAQAGLSGSAAGAVLVMTAFAVGTVPALALLALTGRTVARRLHSATLRLAGWGLILVGVTSWWRAVAVWVHGA